MSTWTCPRCLNTVVDKDTCDVCGTYHPPVMQPQSIEVDHLKPQTLSSPANERFEELIRANGSKTIYDRENDYIIEYTKEDGYVAFDIDGKEVYHIYNDGTVSLTLSDGSKLHNYNSDLTIDDMKRTMKFTNDDGDDYYVTDRSLTKKVEYNHDWDMTTEETYGFEPTRKEIYSDGRVVYYDEKEKVYRVDYPGGSFHIRDKIFSENGCYYGYEDDRSLGTYTVDKDGNFTCVANDGSVTVYGGKTFKVLRTVDKDGIVTVYNYNNSKELQTIVRNGKATYSRINHIEYDEEAYENILKTFNTIGESRAKTIDTCIDTINTVNTLPDKYTSEEISGITNNVRDDYDLVSSLSEMTNYSILAYQTCDDSLVHGLYSIIDSLFGDEPSLYGDIFKKEIGLDIENNNGILKYREGTDFRKIGKVLGNIETVLKHIEDINPERFGISKLEMYEDLKYINETRGEKEVDLIIYALKHNCPKNFSEYSFNPGVLNKGYKHYDFNNNTIGNYQTNSDFIDINGRTMEFVQVLPKDCTKTEQLAYDFTKANVINTMKTFPDKYIDAAMQKNNVIVLTCDKKSQSHPNNDWGGYYSPRPNNFLFPETGVAAIDANGSLYDNEYYTIDVVIHEYGHKFDDSLYSGIFELINNAYFSDNSNEWYQCYNKYKKILPDIVEGSYTDFDSTLYPYVEFFAESMVAYFKEPDELKRLCPEVYDETTKLLGGDYGGAYSNSVYNQWDN